MRAVHAERGLDDMRRVALLAVHPLELRPGGLRVRAEVEVAAVRDPLQLRPADREEVLEVARRGGVVGELLGVVRADAQVALAECRSAGARRRAGRPSSGTTPRPRAGGTKYSISICSNSRVRKMKLPGVISLRNALPICAMPNGGLRRAIWATFLKLTKMPCAVSGRRNASEPRLLDRADPRLEHEVELPRLGEVALVGLAWMLARSLPALRLLELVGAVAALAEAAVDERVARTRRRGPTPPTRPGEG